MREAEERDREERQRTETEERDGEERLLALYYAFSVFGSNILIYVIRLALHSVIIVFRYLCILLSMCSALSVCCFYCVLEEEKREGGEKRRRKPDERDRGQKQDRELGMGAQGEG